MPAGTTPTLVRRQLGTMLRAHRVRKGLTVADVAERLMCTPSKISRIETGHRLASLRDVRDLSDIYDVRDLDARNHLMDLARQGRERGWWQQYDLLAPTSTYVGLEAAASRICEFESARVPGLLQVSEYTRAITNATLPRLTDDQIADLIEVRAIRQQILTRDDPPQIRIVMDEAVLHRAVGGNTVMRSQLDQIMDRARLPNVVIQIIPFEGGAHPGLDGTFVLMDFDEPSASSIVYVEGMIGQLYLDHESDVARYREAFNRLQDDALNREQSLTFIAKARARNVVSRRARKQVGQ